MKSVRDLFNHLEKSQKQGLIYTLYRSKILAGVNEVEITFTNRVPNDARDNLAQYIKMWYDVQVWWVNSDILHVQDYPIKSQK